MKCEEHNITYFMDYCPACRIMSKPFTRFVNITKAHIKCWFWLLFYGMWKGCYKETVHVKGKLSLIIAAWGDERVIIKTFYSDHRVGFVSRKVYIDLNGKKTYLD